MLFAFLAIWSVQKEWEIGPSSINVIYETPYSYTILVDGGVLTDTGLVLLSGDLDGDFSIRRVLVSGDSIFFLTSSMETPVIIYLRRESTAVKLPVRGAFVDYDPSARIFLSPMSLLGSHSYVFSDSLQPVDIYGIRIATFSDSVLYVDRYGNLRFLSGRVLLGGVKNILPYGENLLVLASGSALILDEDFRVKKSIPRTFEGASGFIGAFLLASGAGVYLWELDSGTLETLFQAEDSIVCLSPVDYDGDGVMEVLVSTVSGLYLYSNPMASAGERMEKVMVEGYGYPSTCGGLYGIRFMRRMERGNMVRLHTRYLPDGWEVSFRAPEDGRVKVKVINSRGITVFSKEIMARRGESIVEIRNGFKPGTYTIVLEGETFRGRRTVIWKGR